MADNEMEHIWHESRGNTNHALPKLTWLSTWWWWAFRRPFPDGHGQNWCLVLLLCGEWGLNSKAFSVFPELSLSVLPCFYSTPSVPKAAISRVVLSQTFKTLTKFIEKNAKIYSTKLIPLDFIKYIFIRYSLLFSIKLVKVKQVWLVRILGFEAFRDGASKYLLSKWFLNHYS